MTTPTKRRRLTVEDKLRILEEAQQPGVQIADRCLRHGIATSQFYGWRERAKHGAKAAMRQPLSRKGRSRNQGKLVDLRAHPLLGFLAVYKLNIAEKPKKFMYF